MANYDLVNIDVLDTRLTDDGIEWYCKWTKGGDPNKRMLVNGNMALDKFFQDLKARLKDNKLGILSLLSHGLGEWEYADRQMKQRKKIHGGFGIEFCKENIMLETVGRFGAIKGLFGDRNLGIKLMGCAAAAEYKFAVYPGGPIKQGFGGKLCKQLAIATNTGVMASESLQDVTIDRNPRRFRWGADIQDVKSCVDFGDWEGAVWIFRPDGTVSKYRSDSK